MKKVCKILLFITLQVFLISCDQLDQYKNYRLDGMWQLKTVQDMNGNTIHVDTVYYSFHREAIFSFTVLENPKFALYPVYGYIDMPEGNKVHVLIDKNIGENDNFEWFLSLSGWSAADIIFDIKKHNQLDLILFDRGNGKTYTLKKF